MTEEANDFEGDFRTAAEANARKAAELEEKLLEQLETKLEAGRMEPKDLSSALQAVANMKARNIEKLRAGDKPPEKTPDPEELIASMARKGYLRFSGPAAGYEPTAHDPTDPEDEP